MEETLLQILDAVNALKTSVDGLQTTVSGILESTNKVHECLMILIYVEAYRFGVQLWSEVRAGKNQSRFW